MKLLKNRQSGQALVMALILLALGGLLIVPGLNLAITNLKYHQLIEGKTFEAYSADSGVEYALCKLRNDPDGYRDPENPLELNFPLNGRTVNVTAEYMGSNVHKITSTATSADGRSTTIECYSSITSGLFGNAAVSNGKMHIANSSIDSAPVQGEADISCNGDFVLHGSTVYGDVTYTGTLDMDEYSVVTGDITQEASAEELPPIDTQFWKDKAQAGGTHNGDLQIQDESNYYLGPLYITGTLQIQNSDIILDGTVYVLGEIQVQESTIVGSSIIISENHITLQTAAYDPENIPIIMSVNGKITCQSGSLIGAVLYAPNLNVILQGTVLYGSAVGDEVTVQDSTIMYVAEVQACEGLPGSQVNIFTYSFN